MENYTPENAPLSNGDEPYSNLDLDTAEELLIHAGKPELAKALRYQTQGIRNLVQGEWGSSFVNALENVMDTRVVSVLTSVQQRLDTQIGLVERVLVATKENARGLKKLTQRAHALETRMDSSEADRLDLRQRLERIERIMAERPEQRAAEHQALLAAIKRGNDGTL